MMPRLRVWLEETHGAGFELVRHFLSRIFDSEMFSVPGEWQKTAAGLLAALLSFGILALPTYMKSFDLMREAGLSSAQIYREIRANELTFIAVGMAITALLTALVWQSLFPSLRDCLALAGLPVSARQIFVAKASALVLFIWPPESECCYRACLASCTDPRCGVPGDNSVLGIEAAPPRFQRGHAKLITQSALAGSRYCPT